MVDNRTNRPNAAVQHLENATPDEWDVSHESGRSARAELDGEYWVVIQGFNDSYQVSLYHRDVPATFGRPGEIEREEVAAEAVEDHVEYIINQRSELLADARVAVEEGWA